MEFRKEVTFLHGNMSAFFLWSFLYQEGLRSSKPWGILVKLPWAWVLMFTCCVVTSSLIQRPHLLFSPWFFCSSRKISNDTPFVSSLSLICEALVQDLTGLVFIHLTIEVTAGWTEVWTKQSGKTFPINLTWYICPAGSQRPTRLSAGSLPLLRGLLRLGVP